MEKMVAEAKKEKPRLPPNPKGKSVKALDYRGYGQASEQVENILVHRSYSKAAQPLGINEAYSRDCDRSVTWACYEYETLWQPNCWCPGATVTTSPTWPRN